MTPNDVRIRVPYTRYQYFLVLNFFENSTEILFSGKNQSLKKKFHAFSVS